MTVINCNEAHAPPRCLFEGGAIGVLGSIDLKEYNPRVITIGAVRTLAEPCGDQMNSSRHYRFVTVGEQEYDFWPTEFASNRLVHVGHAFLLDPTATNPAAYLGLDSDLDLFPATLSVHSRDIYRAGFQHMIPENPSCSSVVIGGWEPGHWCTMDEECQSGTCFGRRCSDGTVVKLESGAECSNHTQCQSGACRWNWWVFGRRCD
jgi:hypothetical protein